MKNHPDYVGRGRSVVFAIAVLGFGCIALLWGWNTFAADLLSQQPMKFRHALALELLLISVAAIFPITWRFLGAQSR